MLYALAVWHEFVRAVVLVVLSGAFCLGFMGLS